MTADFDPLKAAIAAGYRITVHARYFPFESLDPEKPGKIHAVVDKGARAIFCSQEWLDRLKAVIA